MAKVTSLVFHLFKEVIIMGLVTKAGEGFVSSLVDNLSTSYGEIASEIAGNYSKALDRNVTVKIANALAKNGPDGVKKVLDLNPLAPEVQMAKQMNTVVRSGISDKDKFNWIRKQQVEKHGALAGNALFAGQVAKAYMFQDGKKAARIGTYVGGSVGLRVLSGGSLTHNNTGERDIAGIPFI
jgi:hypothetical protein